MRKIAAWAAAIAVAVGAVSAATAGADPGPNSKCWGEIASGIASTWPWAHDNKSAFPPPPGGIAGFIEAFGPQIGISSVQELRQLFCTG